VALTKGKSIILCIKVKSDDNSLFFKLAKKFSKEKESKDFIELNILQHSRLYCFKTKPPKFIDNLNIEG